MNKLKLTIDVDRINLENENHTRNFPQKIKNLAQHCVNYINNLIRISLICYLSNTKKIPYDLDTFSPPKL